MFDNEKHASNHASAPTLGAVAAAAGITAAGIAAATACAAANTRHDHPAWQELSRHRYAHRGLFDEPLSASTYPVPGRPLDEQRWHADVATNAGPVVPENSLAAFRRAAEHGFGVELDVHLSASGTLPVVHDSDLSRLCSVPLVIEDLTAEKIDELLLLDTEEHIPTLDQVLEVFSGTDLPLIVEIKTHGDNAAQVTSAAVACLEQSDVVWCMESFDPRVLIWLRHNRPGVFRGQLSQNFVAEPPAGLSAAMGAALTGLLGNALTRPDFVAYKSCDRGLPLTRLACDVCGGHEVNWTIRSQVELDDVEREGHVGIFERFVPESATVPGR